MNENGSCDAAYQKVVLLKCYDALSAAGFTRYKTEAVDWPLNDAFHCWVGLNTELRAEYVGINPFVGIHVRPIEKLWTKLKVGRYPGKYNRSIATYSRHMGELAPDEPVFRFTGRTDIDAEAVRLARLYVSVGVTYAQSIASYEHLLPLLRERVEMRGAYPERTAVCLYLMGRRDEARSFVDSFMRDNLDYFEGFARPFIEMLRHDGNGAE